MKHRVQPLYVLYVVIGMTLIWIFRPFFHPLIMLFYVHPIALFFAGAIIAGILNLWETIGDVHWRPRGRESYKLEISAHGWKRISGFIVLLILTGMLFSFEGAFRYAATAKHTDYKKIDDLPQFQPIRLTPKGVAKRYADDSFQNPQEYLGNSQIMLLDGRITRVFPRLPDGSLLYFLKKMGGFVTVDVDTLERKVSIADQEFKYAQGIGVFDNLYYKLLQKKYFVSYTSEPGYVKNDEGTWVTVIPYTGYRGVFFRVPYWAGVMIVNSEGKIQDYSPEDAQQISYLKGNRIYPKELAEYYADSYAYHLGAFNKWFIHDEETEVVKLPNDEDVLDVPTTSGFKQMVVAEPYGRSYGIYRIFFFDATTGERQIIEYDVKSQLTGPKAAADYIKKEFPTFDWNVFSVAEPRPLKVGQDLYWLMSIVPNDAAGIAATITLNARTNTVMRFDSEHELREFAQNGKLPESVGNDEKNAQIRQKINSLQKELDGLRRLLP